MGSELPALTEVTFRERLEAASGRSVPAPVAEKLFAHYGELCRWNPTVSLVGPGTAAAVVERHYAESLAGVPLIGGARRLLDVGSGAGFPAVVLAAAEPSLEVYLVESRQRKWAFLESACRAASLSCVCLNARVDSSTADELPTDLDLVTARAVRLAPTQLALLAGLLRAGGRLLLWMGSGALELPNSLAEISAQPLAGSRERRLVEIGQVAEGR